jgi:hypothetical protein
MTRGTIVWVVCAVASVVAVIATTPAHKPAVVAIDEGGRLCPELLDPAAVTLLDVRRWNAEDAQAERFVVEQRDGVWTIPSHGGYPAEATDRMARAASSLVGVTKAKVRSDRAEEHPEFGVVDPEDATASHEGKGERITLADEAGAVLADVIIGKPVPGAAQRRFVRLADSNRVYEVEVRIEVSTRFADWIDPDVLDVRRDEIIALTLHSYRVDEATGRVLGDEPLRIVRSDASRAVAPGGGGEAARGAATWIVEPGAGARPTAPLDRAKVEALLTAVDQLGIVGVRPQPEVLTDVALRKKGFFVVPPRIYGNEGELEIELADGTAVRLYFGEIAPRAGLALTAGIGEEEAAAALDPAASGEAPRYVFITASHGASGARDGAGPGAGPSPEPRSPQAEDAAADHAATSDVAPPDLAAAGPPLDGAGAQRAQRLHQRFSRWFFVIDGGTFAKLRPMPETFFVDEPPDALGRQP